MAAEETGGLESDGIERESWELIESWYEKRNDTGQVDIYRFENIRSGFKSELLRVW
jgi:hypothetical protein